MLDSRWTPEVRERTRRCKNRTKSVVSGVLLQVWAWDSEEIEGAREDDDPKTTEIMSKVLLFAEDDKIKDPMILSSIRI